MEHLKLATMWLGGCSGCHMSFLDLDEFLIDLAGMIDIVYTPLIDVKAFPERVDVTLLEGAVANQDHLEFVKMVRARTTILISFGDCAVTGNVTAMRKPLGAAEVVLAGPTSTTATWAPRFPAARGYCPNSWTGSSRSMASCRWMCTFRVVPRPPRGSVRCSSN